MSPKARREAVERALAYPYGIPSGSYLLAGGRALDPAAAPVDLSARRALLAYGSNAAPEVLARKLGEDPEPLPVLRAALRGFDVVYSAHVSPYGAVPGTLRRSPGTEVRVFVAYPTEAQLRTLTATEPNYELGTLRGGVCQVEGGGSPAGLLAYRSRHGCLLLGGTEVALEAVEARGRALPAMGQREVLERVRDLHRPGLELERFVAECASGDAPRLEAAQR